MITVAALNRSDTCPQTHGRRHTGELRVRINQNYRTIHNDGGRADGIDYPADVHRLRVILNVDPHRHPYLITLTLGSHGRYASNRGRAIDRCFTDIHQGVSDQPQIAIHLQDRARELVHLHAACRSYNGDRSRLDIV